MLIDIRNIYKIYNEGKESEVRALDDVSLQIDRGEFVAMLVQTLKIPVDENVTNTGFTDNIPSWLKPYVAAAQRAGLMTDWPEGQVFGAEEAISDQQAAMLLQNALSLPLTTVFQEQDRTTEELVMATLAENGILFGGNLLTRGEMALALYRAYCLGPTAPGTAVFFQM